MVKTEMAMRDNGNYESIVSPIQHKCDVSFSSYCVEYGWDLGKLYFKLEDGDPYKDGSSCSFEVNYCPCCGYHPM
jgi:hypothetical protein